MELSLRKRLEHEGTVRDVIAIEGHAKLKDGAGDEELNRELIRAVTIVRAAEVFETAIATSEGIPRNRNIQE